MPKATHEHTTQATLLDSDKLDLRFLDEARSGVPYDPELMAGLSVAMRLADPDTHVFSLYETLKTWLDAYRNPQSAQIYTFPSADTDTFVYPRSEY